MAISSPLLMKQVRSLVGDITESDLVNVDCYLANHLGIFIPSLGHCGYAIKPLHTHPSYSFILFPGKEQCFKELTTEIPPGKYLVVAISPEIPHQETQEDNFKRYFAILIAREFYESEYSAYASEPPPTYEWTSFFTNTELMASIKSFMSEYENTYPGREKNLDALALIITHQLIRNQLKMLPLTSNKFSGYEVENVLAFMNQHYGERINIARLASLARLSVSHFYKVFKRETSQTPMDYLNQIRLNNAKKMLRANKMTITQIALHCGYNSASHFSSCFSKNLDITPSKYMELYNLSADKELR